MSEIELTHIVADDKAQPRTLISAEKVAEYVEDMTRGDKFPPLVVFKEGGKHWLADGFHRYYAAKTAEIAAFECEVREGSLRDAILYSCSANASHGLRRTTSDKRRAVITMLRDAKWATWADEEIARHCAVDAKTVAKYKKEMVTPEIQSEERTYIDKHGNESTMNTANIGRKKAETLPPSRIVAGLKDIERWLDVMPEPKDAVRDFPADQWYYFPMSKLEEMAAWLTQFAAEWRRVGPPK